MLKRILRTVSVCVFAVIFCTFVSAQSGPYAADKEVAKNKISSSKAYDGGNPVLNLAGEVSVVVIKSAAKTAWATTKFAAKDVAKPILVGIAKPLLLKATPQITMFLLKLTGKSLQKGIPIATKLGMTYLRAKLPF